VRILWLFGACLLAYCVGVGEAALQPQGGDVEIGLTQSQDGRFLYIRCYGWPGNALRLVGVNARKDGQVTLLGDGDQRSVHWKNDGDALLLSDLSPLRYVSDGIWVFRIEGGFVEGSPFEKNGSKRPIEARNREPLGREAPLLGSTSGESHVNIGASVGPVETSWNDWTSERL
jgi:hypothetical protein